MGDKGYYIFSIGFFYFFITHTHIKLENCSLFWAKTSLCLSDFQAMSRCSQPIPCSAFNNDGSIFAYSVCSTLDVLARMMTDMQLVLSCHKLHLVCK